LTNQYSDLCSSSTTPPPPGTPSSGTSLCGYWQYTYTSNDHNTAQTDITLQTLQQSLYNVALDLVDKYNQQLLPNTAGDPVDLSVVQDDQLAINHAINVAAQNMMLALGQNAVTLAEQSPKADWLQFPSVFYDWLSKGSLTPPSLNSLILYPGTTSMNKNGNPSHLSYDLNYQTFVSDINQCNFFNAQTIMSSINGSSSAFELQAPDSSIGPVSYMYSVMQDMVSNNNEPLITLAIFGQTLLKLAFDMMMAAVILGGIMVGVSAICASQLSTFAIGMTTALGGFLTSIMLAFGFLIPMGVSLGIYLPLMPVTMYALGALMWFMTVVESMVAGPVIALGLVIPSQSNFGKAEPSILMLFNVFLRPSLMVIGMVLGTKMFDIFSIYFSNVTISAFASIGKTAGFNQWYGLVFIIFWFFFGFSIVAVAQRCFSLIYVLPDKVINWIGGQGGSSRDISEDLQTMQQSLEKGGEALKKEVSGVASGMMQMAKDVGEKGGKDKQGGAGKGKGKGK
jgi:conjugal transfer/type IV secretion protein DotA/TraY